MFGIVHTFHARIQRGGGGQGVRPLPLENHNNIGFVSYTDHDPLKITKTDWQFEMFKRGKANGHDTCLVYISK